MSTSRGIESTKSYRPAKLVSATAALAAVAVWLLVSCDALQSAADHRAPLASWSWVDGASHHGLNIDPNRSAHYPQLTSDELNLRITWFESNGHANQIRMARLSGDSWQPEDGGGAHGINADPASDARWSRIALTTDGHVVSWHEWDASVAAYRIRVATRSGGLSGYEFVDGGGLHAGSGYDAIHASVVNFEGLVHAAWRERAAGEGTYQVRVARLSEGVEFIDRGAGGGINQNTELSAYYPKLAVHDGQIHIAWHENFGVGRTVRAARLNAADEWTSLVDSERGLNYDTSAYADGPQLISAGEVLVALWTERNSGPRTTLRISGYSNERWSFLDGGLATGLAWDPAASIRWARGAVHELPSGAWWLLVAWAESTAGHDVVRVAARSLGEAAESVPPADEPSPDWIFLSPEEGLVFAGEGDVEYPHVAMHGGDLYVAFSEMIDRTFRVRVARAELSWPRVSS